MVTMASACCLLARQVIPRHLLAGARPLSTSSTHHERAKQWKYNRSRDLVQPAQSPNTEMPERARLAVMMKTPSLWSMGGMKPPKGTRELWRMMGEEKVHNDLLLGQFGIIALTGGMIFHKHFEVLRMGVGRFVVPGGAIFSHYRVDPPYKPITEHGFGKRMGGGKGSIDEYATPVRAGRVILEVGGKAEWAEVGPWLRDVARKLPFQALAVSAEQLDKLREEEKRLQQVNKNPISFEWLIRNNIMNCQTKFSDYDKLWMGKFVYKDRVQNKKFQRIIGGMDEGFKKH